MTTYYEHGWMLFMIIYYEYGWALLTTAYYKYKWVEKNIYISTHDIFI